MNRDEFRKFVDELKQYLGLEYCITNDDRKTTAKFYNQKRDIIIRHRWDREDILVWCGKFSTWIQFDYVQIDSVSPMYVYLDFGGRMRINLRREA